MFRMNNNHLIMYVFRMRFVLTVVIHVMSTGVTIDFGPILRIYLHL